MSVSSLQADFFHRMQDPLCFRLIFEHIPDTYFFVKDDRSRFIAASQAVVQRLGRKDEKEILGLDDHAFYPSELADQYMLDDQRIVKTGQPLIGRVEVCYSGQKLLDWFVTTKLPITDRRGRVIGIMGVTRSHQNRQATASPYASVSRAVEYIHQNPGRKLALPEVASAAGLSQRQLTRLFNDAFGMSPYKFILRTRIQEASEALLRTPSSISEIALDFGFCDQSAFTKQFHAHLGMTPTAYRERHANRAQ